MSGKRHKKKEEQRPGALEHRLADLYRRQADVACLDLIHERGRHLPLERLSPDRYREAVDRALRDFVSRGKQKDVLALIDEGVIAPDYDVRSVREQMVRDPR